MRWLLLVSMAISVTCHAEWRVDVSWDGMTDRPDATAYSDGEKHLRLSIIRSDDGSARVNLHIEGLSFTYFADDPQLQYRVDEGAPISISPAGPAQMRVNANALGWRVSEKAILPGDAPLRQILAGKRMLVRYLDSRGQVHDAAFDLAGAARATRLAFELMSR